MRHLVSVGRSAISTLNLLLAVALLAAGLAILYGLARGLLWLVGRGAERLQGPVRMSRHWVRDRPVVALFESRFPQTFRFLKARLSTRPFTGLPLTLMVIFTVYLVALFGGMVQELHEAEDLVALDNAVDRWFDAHRVEPFIGAMVWLTLWGQGPTITIVGLVASLLWWSSSRGHLVVPFWICLIGAQVTTWTAKYVIARERPGAWDLLDEHSPAFPSGHATAAISVYGFIAYSVWRTIQTQPRARFEVLFWGAVAIMLIGFSRIYLSVHFLSDVASGYLVGGFWLAVAVTVTEWRTARRDGRRTPNGHGPDRGSDRGPPLDLIGT
ncbi:phosphatase PAP2 family protein [Skermanella sp. TT6]|uniref:Phosphatase PAP2 family protein n=1 Tax=Skermanella cutis TaxID=2775420 RepID=A0ABX7BAT1_9PROT|nr:phosphatase PAP2 family protein [Skermanella sp. TT6]QQP90860.2 phosphatase PAP2 family protein [Skermanella sp. TT6]